jgi:hypothetical protein
VSSEYKWTKHKFTYSSSGPYPHSVELRGSFKPDGWDNGYALSGSNSNWSETVPVPCGMSISYKYVRDYTDWVTDSCSSYSYDWKGRRNCLLKALACSNGWECGEKHPVDCPASDRSCDMLFVFPEYWENEEVDSVYLMGIDGDWSTGMKMGWNANKSRWERKLPHVPWGSEMVYKFRLSTKNGWSWAADPENECRTDPDDNSCFMATCDRWKCAGID